MYFIRADHLHTVQRGYLRDNEAIMTTRKHDRVINTTRDVIDKATKYFKAT